MIVPPYKFLISSPHTTQSAEQLFAPPLLSLPLLPLSSIIVCDRACQLFVNLPQRASEKEKTRENDNKNKF